jgi:hypothetical protein
MRLTVSALSRQAPIWVSNARADNLIFLVTIKSKSSHAVASYRGKLILPDKGQPAPLQIASESLCCRC